MCQALDIDFILTISLHVTLTLKRVRRRDFHGETYPSEKVCDFGELFQIRCIPLTPIKLYPETSSKLSAIHFVPIIDSSRDSGDYVSLGLILVADASFGIWSLRLEIWKALQF